MNCEEIRDLLPACMFGTATADEVGAVEDHLAGCELHEEVAALAASAALVGSGSKSVEPPAALKTRVMAHAAASTGDVRPERAAPRRPWVLRIVTANPIAAVLVVALVVMVAWNVTLREARPAETFVEAEPTETFVHFYRGQESDWLRIETVLGDPGAEVSLGGFERLDDSQLYHLWATRGDQVLLVGAFNVNTDGKWAGEFDFVFEEGDRVWMTPESASGTDQPTAEAVFKTRF